MYYDILAQLLDSSVRSRLLKLFFRNKTKQYKLQEVVERTQSRLNQVRAEIRRLENLKFVKSSKRKGVVYYYLNKQCRYYNIMEKFVAELGVTPLEQLEKLVTNLGLIKLAYASGVFIKKNNSKVDLFLVGEDISKAKLKNLLKRLEAETGKEIDYTLMDTQEYEYRKGLFDRFVSQVEEGPYEVLVDKLSAGKKFCKIGNYY